ncbi:hypothetical protein Pelo_15029 [Pelomyxa schiedti]|nr:hypothetical protein Pelo_15029 [Pelomyxa schiedti]
MEHVRAAMADNPVAVFSTHDGAGIDSRPMMLLHNDALGFYFVTRKGSKKLAQITACADVSLLVGRTDMLAPFYCEVQARCAILDDPRSKMLAWNDGMRAYGYANAEDPILVVLQLHFDRITRVDMKNFRQEVFEVTSIESAIANRRSVRKYTSEKVPRDILERVLNAANWGPTGMGAQPLHFYAQTNPEKLRDVASAVGNAIPEFKTKSCWYDAPVAIAVTIVPEKEHQMKVKLPVEIDAGMAAQNMMIEAYGCGLSTCPIGIVLAINKDILKAAFEIPMNERVVLCLTLGYSAENPPVVPRNWNNANLV